MRQPSARWHSVIEIFGAFVVVIVFIVGMPAVFWVLEDKIKNERKYTASRTKRNAYGLLLFFLPIIVLIILAVVAVAAIVVFVIWSLANLVSIKLANRFSDQVDRLLAHLPAPLRPA